MQKSRLTKIISSITLCLMLGVSLFAGCDLVTRDMGRYYNAVVASYTHEDGTRVDVTKKELIVAYNSFGYQYSQSVPEMSDALKLTIDRIIDKKLTVEALEEEAPLDKKERTYLWETTFEQTKASIINYYDRLNNTNSSDEDSSDGVVSEKTFTPTAKYENGELKYVASTQKMIDQHVFWSTVDRDVEDENDLEVLYQLIVDYVDENPVYAKAFNRYISALRQSEEGQHLSTDNRGVFKREIKTIYESLYDNYAVTKYTELHKIENPSASVQNILELYENKVKSDFNKYYTESRNDRTTYNNDMVANIASMNYVIDRDSPAEFFYVSHILAKFNDGDQALYDECKACLEGKSKRYTISQALQKIEDLYAGLCFKVREPEMDENGNATGRWLETETTKPVLSVMTEIADTLKTIGDEYEKAEYFNQMIYKYNQDDGVFNSERNYVIGVDPYTRDEEKQTPYTILSNNFVEEFEQAAYGLYKNNAKIGDLYLGDDNTYVGGLIRTDYGIHIMMYEGKIENLFSGIDNNFHLSPEDISVLASKKARLKAGESKTLFDVLFEEVNKDNYSIFESMNLTTLREKVDVKYYVDEYKDLF